MAATPALTAAERHRLLVEWNETRADYPRHLCLHQLFEAQASHMPDQVALLFGEQELTYGALNARANRLAHHLRSRRVGAEVPVGLCVDRSVEMVVGMLGILKAGGAFVPVEPTYPKERLAFMLDDSGVPLLLTRHSLLQDLAGIRREIICLDAEWPSIARHSAECPTTGVSPENLAYVIYTSGSTGTPKGIAIEHRGVVNNLHDLNSTCDVGHEDRILAISALSFDMCVYEILGTLAAGATIVMPEATTAKDPGHWAELMLRHRVSVWNSAPPLLELLVDYTELRPDFRPQWLRVAILGGDWVPVTLPDRLRALAPRARVIVLGGATEASIHSIIYEVDKVDPSWRSIPYGRPMANQRAYILDADLQPVPVGTPGQLHLGGIGLARGYFRRPELTAERFLPDPFTDTPGDRIYQTGDLARYMSDGNIELLGRMDHQVKIRGQRIELGEIATVLKTQPAVRDAIVVATDADGEKRLVAYVIPSAEYRTSPEAQDHDAERVSRWRRIYDETFGEAPFGSDPTLNFAGWNSSYTGLPFPEDELRETLNATVERILSLRPNHVLEIGCGTGLLLFRIAPHVSRYDATDFSEVVLRDLRKQLTQPEHARLRVTLACREADRFEGIEPASYDAVIINSVVQHFPNIAYLMRVLEGATRALKPGGAIFVGDLRSLPALPAFHASIERHRAPRALPIEEVRLRAHRRMTQEKELAVDPAFFPLLPHHAPEISRVAIRLKRGRRWNELTKFHYDVILHVRDGRRPNAAVAWLDWEKQGLTLSAVRLSLATHPGVLGIARVPNARLRADTQALGLLADPRGPRTAGELQDALRDAPPTDAIDPEDFWALGDALSYSVEISWSAAGLPDRFDVLFTRQGATDVPPAPFPSEARQFKRWSDCANTPLQADDARRLIPDLRAWLEQKLPDYMVPRDFGFLDAFPLSPNGKVDRRALALLDRASPARATNFVAPHSALQTALAAIWSEVLGLERVGVHDDFFGDLAGHSLTATQVVLRINALFGLAIPLRCLFESSTVASLAEHLERLGGQAGLDVSGIADAFVQVRELPDDAARALLAAKSRRS